VHDQNQTIREVTTAIFFSLLSLYDASAERESVQLLKDHLSTGIIQDPAARSILHSIIMCSRAASLEAA
jgi:hypothetical protein